MPLKTSDLHKRLHQGLNFANTHLGNDQLVKMREQLVDMVERIDVALGSPPTEIAPAPDNARPDDVDFRQALTELNRNQLEEYAVQHGVDPSHASGTAKDDLVGVIITARKSSANPDHWGDPSDVADPGGIGEKLKALKKAQLQEYAEAHEVDLAGASTKKDIVEKLVEAHGSAASPDEWDDPAEWAED